MGQMARNGPSTKLQTNRTIYAADDCNGPLQTANGPGHNSTVASTSSGVDDYMLGVGSKWLEYSDSTSECGWYTRTARLDSEPCDENQTFVDLRMAKNGLLGSLPPELAMLSNLKANKLTGTGLRREWMTSWTKLARMRLTNNDLLGTMPTEIGLLNHSLGELAIGTNRFTGTIPTELYHLTKLEGTRSMTLSFWGLYQGFISLG